MALPIAPAPQQVILQSGNGVNLVTWLYVPGATSYQVQRSLDGITFSNLGTSTGTSYTDSAVSVGVTYYYQIGSVNGSGTSAYSASYPPNITPCLPGQINLGYLRYMSQLRADKLTSQYLTTDEWNWNINQSTNELYDILINRYGEDYFFAPVLIISLTGAISYPVPDGSNYPISSVNSPALYKLNGIDVNVSGQSTGANAGWTPLARANWSDRDRFTTWPAQAGALNNIYQMSYREMGNQFYFFPQNTNLAVRVWYVPILSQMLLDTDMLSFSISGWSEYVIVDAAMKAMIKEKSSEKYLLLEKSKMALINRITSAASNRDVGQINSISNVRATMSDPGFAGWGIGATGGGFGGGGQGS